MIANSEILIYTTSQIVFGIDFEIFFRCVVKTFYDLSFSFCFEDRDTTALTDIVGRLSTVFFLISR